jgi:hypothetical protein
MSPLIIQVVISLCAAGVNPVDCRHNSPLIEAAIDGPLVSSNLQCQREGQMFLASMVGHGDQRLNGHLASIRCEVAGDGHAPQAEYGKIGDAGPTVITPLSALQ